MPRLLPLALIALILGGCAVARVDLAPAPSTAEVSAAEAARGQELFPIVVGGVWGYIDAGGETVIEPQFSAARDFSEGRAAARSRVRWGYIRPDGTWATEPVYASVGDFSDGRGLVGKGRAGDRLYGYVDAAGAEVVAPVLPYALPYSEGLALVRLTADDRTGVQEFLARIGALPSATGFAFLDREGRVAFEVPGVGAASFSDGLAPFETDRGLFRSTAWGYLDASGEVAIAPELDGPAFRFSEDLARVARGGRLGFIDAEGAFAIEPAYSLAFPFSGGLAPVQVDGRWGYIAASGEVVIAPRFLSALAFSDGLAPVQTAEGWGYIDRSGAFVIPPQYARAEPFARGLARVYAGRSMRYITASGETVWAQN